MQAPTVSCFSCGSARIAPLLYGNPTIVDFPSRWAYGGPEAFADAPTHLCLDCNDAWIQRGATAVTFPLPDHCNFCDEAMSDKDRFLYSTEFESWIEQEHSQFTLEGGTFSDFPFPTCKSCRGSIHENQQALDDEKHHEEKMRIVAIRFAIAGAIFFVLLVLWCLINSYDGRL